MPTRATTREWRRLAELDPFYAIAAWPGRAQSWTKEDFYDSGLEEWEDFKRVWTQYAALSGTCVEIGCGAGRITAGLALTFREVLGLDVSEAMLELAREAVPSARFMLVDSTTIPLPDDAADAVFTCHVLQHLETPADVFSYLREAHRVLRPGGSAMVHIALSARPKPMYRRLISEARLRATRMMNANEGAYARFRRYRPDEIREFMERAGFREVELREFRLLAGKSSPHPFWLGRKASAAL